jgi:DNA-binding transcriptional MerR regulator
MFSIRDVAELVGVDPSVIRQWEFRYGWPLPRRQANGYRIYGQNLVDQIIAVVDYSRETGLRISQIVVDGEPRLPRNQPARPELPAFDQWSDDAVVRYDQTRLAVHLQNRAPEILGTLERLDRHYRPVDLIRYFLRPATVVIDQIDNDDTAPEFCRSVSSWIGRRCSGLVRNYGRGLLGAMESDEDLTRFVVIIGATR